MFLQIHTLTSYPPALLNRDDAGLAKRVTFGNAERMRVSSQCLKKHWRDALHETTNLPTAVRSRMFFERVILPGVIQAGVEESLAKTLTEAALKLLVDGGQDKDNPLKLNQPILFGRPEADYIVKLLADMATQDKPAEALKQAIAGAKKNFRAMLAAAGHGNTTQGIEGAMFGRFVTSDILARTDAAVHVAHAITVHPLASEVDYFTVVDDLKTDDEDAGAAHAGETELGAGLFYGYVVIDLPLLVSNLTGCERKAWKDQSAEDLQAAKALIADLVGKIAKVSPGAKKGSTAPYARASMVLLETGMDQPRTLSNAFLKALKPTGDLVAQSINAVSEHLAVIDRMYGKSEQRFLAAACDANDTEGLPQRETLDVAIDKALATAFDAAS